VERTDSRSDRGRYADRPGQGLEIPASWLLEGVTVEQVATGLRPLLEKPVEFVLPTHGEPTDRAALEHALA
jgi:hypothetical protein